MRFSIIIPLYNKEKYILDTINSVLNQTFTDYEIIVVDDSSTDNSWSIVNTVKDDKVKIFRKKNEGVSLARNYGISRATGDFVCFLDADDLWLENYLSTVDYYINRYPDVKFFCTAYKKFKVSPSDISSEVIAKCNSDVVDYFEASISNTGPIALTSAVVVSRELLLSLDYLFLPNISMGEDLDLWTRVALKSNVCYIPRTLMLYRSYAEGSLTSGKSSLQRSFHYWVWYSYSDNKYLKQFTTLLIYTLARNLYKAGECKDASFCLSKIKGGYWRLYRIKLRFQLFAKKL